MLLWEVINDGEVYNDRIDALILPDMMHRLRKNGEVGSLAYDVCLSKIKKRHIEEHGNIRRVALEALQDSLRANPLVRPSALALLTKLQKSLPDEKYVRIFSKSLFPKLNGITAYEKPSARRPFLCLPLYRL